MRRIVIPLTVIPALFRRTVTRPAAEVQDPSRPATTQLVLHPSEPT